MKVTHAVDEDGQVYCAKQRKNIDVLACYACKRSVEIDLDSRKPRVTCELDRTEETRRS